MNKSEQKQISYKQVGQNVILVIEGQQYSKKIAEKTDREAIKQDVEAYNKKNTATKLKTIMKVISADSDARKKQVAEVKAVKANTKKTTKPPKAAKKKVKEEVKEKVAEVKKEESTYVPRTAPTRRSGEW